MDKVYDVTDAGDSERTLVLLDMHGNDRIIRVGDNATVLAQNAEDRKHDGFDITRSIRRVARIDMGTVRYLANVEHDADARAYLEEHDTAARDRLIERYPVFFKACSGGV